MSQSRTTLAERLAVAVSLAERGDTTTAAEILAAEAVLLRHGSRVSTLPVTDDMVRRLAADVRAGVGPRWVVSGPNRTFSGTAHTLLVTAPSGSRTRYLIPDDGARPWVQMGVELAVVESAIDAIWDVRADRVSDDAPAVEFDPEACM